jgi:HK97 family phage prohead protease
MQVLLTFSQEIQAADTERRIVSGLVAPYGEIGHTSAGPVMFERGSITYAEATKIKLLMQHQQDKPVGRAISFSDSTEGVYGSFKLSSSTRGQDALVLAQENLVSGLSVGVDVTASKPMGDYLLVTAAVLKEVSLVESAAFSSASVTDIAAARAALEAATSTKEKTTTISTTIVEIETETETESEEAVTTAPENTPEETPVDAPAEAEKVEAARKIIRPSVLDSQRLRTPITSMATYTEHKIKAALGSDESKLYVTAADDFGTNPAFNPTQYLQEFVTNTRFGTPAIDACSQGVLPASGMTINVPSLVTAAGGGTGVAPTVTVELENGNVSNTDMQTSYLTGNVSKYSGMGTISIELLERSDPNFYAELTQQLENSYLTTIDTAVVNALLAAGTFASATTGDSDGIIAYTSQAAAAVYKNTGYFAQNYIGNAAQWNLLMGATDTTKRPIYNAIQPMNAAGQVGPRSIRGNVLGLDLYVDKNFTETTVDDNSAIILAPEAFTVYRSPQAYMSVNVVSNLQVQVAIYGFMATIAKMPNGIVKFAKLP